MWLTLIVDPYASFTLPLCSHSEMCMLKLSPEPICRVDYGISLTRCIFWYSNVLWAVQWLSTSPKCPCLTEIFRDNQADGELLREQYLVIHSNTINLSLQLIHNGAHISNTPCGGINLSIGEMVQKLYMVVGGAVCHHIIIPSCSSLHLS